MKHDKDTIIIFSCHIWGRVVVEQNTKHYMFYRTLQSYEKVSYIDVANVSTTVCRWCIYYLNEMSVRHRCHRAVCVCVKTSCYSLE